MKQEKVENSLKKRKCEDFLFIVNYYFPILFIIFLIFFLSFFLGSYLTINKEFINNLIVAVKNKNLEDIFSYTRFESPFLTNVESWELHIGLQITGLIFAGFSCLMFLFVLVTNIYFFFKNKEQWWNINRNYVKKKHLENFKRLKKIIIIIKSWFSNIGKHFKKNKIRKKSKK